MLSSYQVLDFGLEVLLLAPCYRVAGSLLFNLIFVLFLAPLTALVIFRDIGLIAAVFWVRYKTVPPPVRRFTLKTLTLIIYFMLDLIDLKLPFTFESALVPNVCVCLFV